VEDLIKAIEERFGEVATYVLDETTHEAAGQLAANANNGGLKDQVEFLLTVAGWSEDDILQAVGAADVR
jgi:hypothetical protein